MQKVTILVKGRRVWPLTLACWAIFSHIFLYSQRDCVLAEEPPQTADAPYANTLRWVTASEVDNFGFDVYRSDSPDGPFARVTTSPIPGAGTSDEPSQYSYTDDTIQPDVQYHYYVESISMAGQREKFTPTFKAPIKSAKSTKSVTYE